MSFLKNAGMTALITLVVLYIVPRVKPLDNFIHPA